MGLTSWKSGAVRKGDVTVAKNYLRGDEIEELNRIVVMFLDFAEDQARRRRQIFLRDWQTRLDEFLRFNDRNVTRDEANEKAQREYDDFAQRRRTHRELLAEADVMREIESIRKP